MGFSVLLNNTEEKLSIIQNVSVYIIFEITPLRNIVENFTVYIFVDDGKTVFLY
jgi:hypothetical protein